MGNQNGKAKIKILRASVKINGEEEGSPRKGRKEKEKDREKEREKERELEKERERESKGKEKRKVEDWEDGEDENDEDQNDELGDEQEFIPSNNNGDNDILSLYLLLHIFHKPRSISRFYHSFFHYS